VAVVGVRHDLGLRSETVRRTNLASIVRELHFSGPLSRSELVARTGLTRSAIGALVGELAAAGLVHEERAASAGTPGRPSSTVRTDPSAAVVLALDIAVDSLGGAIVGLGGDVLEARRVDRRRGRSSVEETIADLAELARAIGYRASLDTVIGIGVAIVGIVRRRDGFVAMAPNLGWRDVPLGALLAAELGTDLPISVANDADLSALGELRRGAATGIDDLLLIWGEVGVGGGIIASGEALTGAAGFGGEIGHFPVNPSGVTCRCGSVGCWETEIGEEALLRRAGHPPSGGRSEVDAVLREAASGEPAAMRALDELGRWLGIGLAGMVNVFDPSLIVLGGLFGRIHAHVATTVRAQLERFALPPSREMVRIVPAALGADAPLRGAAELAFQPMLTDPSAWLLARGAPSALAIA
jgi:predicted NBD/HSP70 family sugar kinase